MRHSMRCAGCCVVALAAAARVHEPSLWRGHLGAPGGSTYAKIFGPGGWYADPLLWGSGDDLGCMGAPAASGRQIFLPETHENGSVAIPRRAGDVRCYAKTKARQRASARRCGAYVGGPGGGSRVAVTVNGELQRMDPNSTVAARVVGPYARGFGPLRRATTSAFDFVVKMRADAGWLADAPAPGVTLEGSAVVVKECLDWGGLNDKLAIVPRKYAAPWMRLLEAYYDDVAADYKNSEQFQLRLAHAARARPQGADRSRCGLSGSRTRAGRAASWNYAGLKPNGHCLCVADRECAAVGDRLCAGQRPLGNDARPGA
ncbi:hypothetical protein JL720_3177 [Aureococcus anophagefferens]|nr:hypothetical protein JL720_3177 [Aureococcus anophagefferens]